jgi:hypothetical protein
MLIRTAEDQEGTRQATVFLRHTFVAERSVPAAVADVTWAGAFERSDFVAPDVQLVRVACPRRRGVLTNAQVLRQDMPALLKSRASLLTLPVAALLSLLRGAAYRATFVQVRVCACVCWPPGPCLTLPQYGQFLYLSAYLFLVHVALVAALLSQVAVFIDSQSGLRSLVPIWNRTDAGPCADHDAACSFSRRARAATHNCPWCASSRTLQPRWCVR